MKGWTLMATLDLFSGAALRARAARTLRAATVAPPLCAAIAAGMLCAAPAFAGKQSETKAPAVARPQSEAKPAAESKPDAAPPAEPTEQDKAAEEMARTRADLLAKHQGADETRLTQLMGPPAEKTARDDGLILVWRGPAGGGDPLPCRIAATLVDGGLANMELSGHPAWDRKTCRKFLRPLLQALPWRSVSHGPDGEGAASEAVLANDTIVQMVRDGLATQSILGRVRSQPCRFDLSSVATSALRRHAVPDVVIQAMSERNCS